MTGATDVYISGEERLSIGQVPTPSISGDSVTAIPLWIAFQLVQRKPSARFTYGLGRVEDLAGITIVAIILFSALVALYEAVDRLIHPQEISLLWAVAIAGVIGFIGNEAVAVFRLRVCKGPFEMAKLR